MHISEGYGDPFTHDLHRLHYVLRGIKHAAGIAGVAKREWRPITPDLLRKIKSVWDPKAEEANVVMLWAACCLTYFGFMWIGELTVSSDDAYDSASHLSWGDIAIDDPACPSCMEVRTGEGLQNRPFLAGHLPLHWQSGLRPLSSVSNVSLPGRERQPDRPPFQILRWETTHQAAVRRGS